MLPKTALLLLGMCLFIAMSTAYAQDGETDKPRFGLRFGLEMGTFYNSRLAGMGNVLRQLNVDTRAVGPLPANGVMSLVMDGNRVTSELRYVTPFSFHEDTPPAPTSAERRARFYGYGVGGSFTLKLINTRRFIVGPTLGYDLVWYRLDLLPVEQKNVAIGSVVNNPTGYVVNTLKQNVNQNLQIGLSGELRIHWQREIRLGTRLGYQLPVGTSARWSLNDGYVGDLPAFRANMLYGQLSGTLFWW